MIFFVCWTIHKIIFFHLITDLCFSSNLRLYCVRLKVARIFIVQQSQWISRIFVSNNDADLRMCSNFHIYTTHSLLWFVWTEQVCGTVQVCSVRTLQHTNIFTLERSKCISFYLSELRLFHWTINHCSLSHISFEIYDSGIRLDIFFKLVVYWKSFSVFWIAYVWNHQNIRSLRWQDRS